MNGNIKAAQTALNELIKVAGGCEDREKLETVASEVFGKHLKNKPALIKRACEAFNSNKAVCYLSKHADSDRGEDFAILNADNIIKRINKEASQAALKKAASFKPLFYSNAPEKKEAEPLQKAASGFDPMSAIKLNINPEILELGIINQLDRHEDVITKLAFGVDMAKSKASQALAKVSRLASHMDKRAKADTLAVCTAHYGPLMTDELANLFSTDVPLRKFASAPRMPQNEISDAVEDYMSYKMVEDSRQAMLKEAAAETTILLKKLAGAYHLQKCAGLPTINTAVAGALASPNVRKTLGLSEDTNEDILAATMTPNLRNVLTELELKRSFFDVLNDDYISTFPIEQIQEAFNAAIQKLPPTARENPAQHTQVLRAWVAKQLSHGSTPSAEDAEDYFKASRYLSTKKPLGLDLDAEDK